MAEIKLKPYDKPAPADFYYRILFDEPFGGTEESNIASRLKRLQRQGYDVDQGTNVTTVAGQLRTFHREFASGCASAQMTEPAIITIVADVPVHGMPP